MGHEVRMWAVALGLGVAHLVVACVPESKRKPTLNVLFPLVFTVFAKPDGEALRLGVAFGIGMALLTVVVASLAHKYRGPDPARFWGAIVGVAEGLLLAGLCGWPLLAFPRS